MSQPEQPVLPKDLFKVLLRDPDYRLAMCFTGFKETGNPYYVWWAIGVCVEHGRSFPVWITHYLGECSSRMLSHRQAGDLRKVLPGVFGFPNKRGPGKLLNPDLGGTTDRRLFSPRLGDARFPLEFAIRVWKGEKPAEARRNACNDVFDKKTADKIDDKTLKRWLQKDFGLENLPVSAERWKPITRQYYERTIGSLLEHYQRTKSRETLG